MNGKIPITLEALRPDDQMYCIWSSGRVERSLQVCDRWALRDALSCQVYPDIKTRRLSKRSDLFNPRWEEKGRGQLKDALQPTPSTDILWASLCDGWWKHQGTYRCLWKRTPRVLVFSHTRKVAPLEVQLSYPSSSMGFTARLWWTALNWSTSLTSQWFTLLLLHKRRPRLQKPRLEWKEHTE